MFENLRTWLGSLAAQAMRQAAAEAVAELPAMINRSQQQKIEALNAEIARLREERTWTKIGVQLHGYKRSHFGGFYAPVMVNPRTGEVKAVPEGERFFSSTRDYWQTKFGCEKTTLAAPRWQSIRDSDALVICGEVYHHK